MVKRGKQDYLRVIHELTESYKKGLKSVEIAKKLGVSKASVSEMMRKLAKENLIEINPYSKIFLTKKGRIQAEKMYDRHYLIRQFIKKYLGHNDEKAYEEAHELEHAFSDESIKIMQKIISGERHEKPLPGYVG
jgi:DtxR family Mn-dependent transcriptional regulator